MTTEDPIAAWRGAWGTAKVARGRLTWAMPVAADQLRAHAQAAYGPRPRRQVLARSEV
jgi:hypothetical protein